MLALHSKREVLISNRKLCCLRDLDGYVVESF